MVLSTVRKYLQRKRFLNDEEITQVVQNEISGKPIYIK